MIPKEISVIDRVVGAQFHQCLLEFFSTDLDEQWILHLKHEKKGNNAFLLDTDNFASFCMGLKQCIDSALNRLDHTGAEMMLNTIAQDLKTNVADGGAITIISSWESDPNVQFNFYSDQNDRNSCITLVYMLGDAMKLYDLFAVAYNKRKHT